MLEVVGSNPATICTMDFVSYVFKTGFPYIYRYKSHLVHSILYEITKVVVALELSFRV